MATENYASPYNIFSFSQLDNEDTMTPPLASIYTEDQEIVKDDPTNEYIYELIEVAYLKDYPNYF